MMEERRERSQLLWGLVLLGLGLIFLLSNFGLISWDLWGRWWPLLLIALGISILLRRARAGESLGLSEPPPPGEPSASLPTVERPREYPTGAIILIGLGLAFLLDDIIGGSAFPALVLIAIGAALILRDRSRR